MCPPPDGDERGTTSLGETGGAGGAGGGGIGRASAGPAGSGGPDNGGAGDGSSGMDSLDAGGRAMSGDGLVGPDRRGDIDRGEAAGRVGSVWGGGFAATSSMTSTRRGPSRNANVKTIATGASHGSRLHGLSERRRVANAPIWFTGLLMLNREQEVLGARLAGLEQGLNDRSTRRRAVHRDDDVRVLGADQRLQSGHQGVQRDPGLIDQNLTVSGHRHRDGSCGMHERG